MMYIKEKIFRYRAEKQAQRKVRFPRWEQVQRILLLSEKSSEAPNTDIASIYQRLTAQGKQVTSWEYTQQKDIIAPSVSGGHRIGRKDISLLECPQQPIIAALQRQPFDLLIDLTIHPSLPLRYLALYAHADFKTGLNLGEGVHDFLIATSVGEDPVYLFEQIIHYLSHIQSND